MAWWTLAAASTCVSVARRMLPTLLYLLAGRRRSAGSTHTKRVDGGRSRRPDHGLHVRLSPALSHCHNPDTWHLKDGTRIELAHAVRRLGDFAPALRFMGGGLTISGGEPLVQMGFTRGLFTAAKRLGLHTALDTSGFLGDRADDDYLTQVDLVLLDVKSGDPETYRRVTGVDLAPTLRFAERLNAMGKPVWIRLCWCRARPMTLAISSRSRVSSLR